MRLVVASNRVGPTREVTRAGGLVVALIDVVRNSGGLWFGWSGNIEPHGVPGDLRVEKDGKVSIATVDLTQQDYEDFYLGYANRTLWPVFHYRLDLALFDRRSEHGYYRVNRQMAERLYPLLEADDLIWVHDYHLIPLGSELRRLGCRQRMGFFLHIPFPAHEILTGLPRNKILIRSLFDYDLVGLQTNADQQRLIHYVVEELGGEQMDEGVVRLDHRTVRVEPFPIGIDTRAFVRLSLSSDAQRQQRKLARTLGNRAQAIGVDRLDYSKGLPERLRSFEFLLENYPDVRGNLGLMQIASPSREEVEAYMQIRRELEGLAGHINGRFGEFDWVPIRYITRHVARRTLAGLYRASQIGLVTPLRDGMNLVAKEYVAAQNPQDPGVLILSRFAGAAEELREALVVNPYDMEGVAEAIRAAMTMPLDERRKRWQALFDRIVRNDSRAWQEQFLTALQEERQAA